MMLVKGFSPLLDCEVWRLQQFACGQWWHKSIAVMNVDMEQASYPRNFVAMRVRSARREVRDSIASFQKEQASVSQDR